MRFFTVDIKRALVERSFLGSILLGTVCMLLSLGFVLSGNEGMGGIELFKRSQSLILPFIAPLLATLPYANMSMLEEDCGYKRLLLSKNGMKSYVMPRWLVSSLVAGVAVMTPVLLLAVICGVIQPYDSVGWVMGIVALNFGFGFSYGSIAYGLTFVNQKRYIPTVAPQVMYLLFIYAFPYLSLEKYYPPLSFSPWLMEGYGDLESIMMQFLVLNALALLLIVGHKIWKTIGESL